MMLKLFIGLFLSSLIVLQHVAPASALSLKMQPLMYKEALQKGEKKKGFVDISNPSSSNIHLKTSVQAFRQIDDEGSLQFFDEPQITAGIIPDLKEFELGPREAIRLYFLVDGTKLPSGDVFGSLFVSTVPSEKSGSATSVRLGTLFVLTNGTPGQRDAEITKLSTGFWHFGDGVNGTFTVKNTAREGTATGFFPSVLAVIEPLGKQQQFDSKLVFAGHTRQNDFQLRSSRLGFYKIAVQYGDSKQEKWVFMATGYWRALGICVAALAIVVSVWRLRQGWKRRNLISK